MQLSLFMIAGAIAYYHGARTLDDLRSLRQRSPWITGALVVVAVGMVGLPPTGGFFGKWNIVLGALEAEHYLAAFAVVASTLLTLAYFVRILTNWFHQPAMPDAAPVELARPVYVSLGIVSVAMIVLGLLSDSIFEFLLRTGGGI
jgi:multicomponent Na+:H+ antiporter subunit D